MAAYLANISKITVSGNLTKNGKFFLFLNKEIYNFHNFPFIINQLNLINKEKRTVTTHI